MKSRLRHWLFFALFALIGIGCGSQSIPTAIVEGTTASITLVADANVGYGRAWGGRPIPPAPFQYLSLDPALAYAFDATNPNEDLQRGELILSLLSETGTPITRLPVRFISRVEIDSATNEATTTTSVVHKKQVIDLVPEKWTSS